MSDSERGGGGAEGRKKRRRGAPANPSREERRPKMSESRDDANAAGAAGPPSSAPDPAAQSPASPPPPLPAPPSGASEAPGPDAGASSSTPLPIPHELAILPLKEAVLFPMTAMPLTVGRKRSLKLVDEQVVAGKIIGTVTQLRADVEEPTEADLRKIGTATSIAKMFKLRDGSARILAQGIQRFRILEILRADPYFVARIETIADVIEDPQTAEALKRTVGELFIKVLSMMANLPDELPNMVSSMEHPGKLADFVAGNLPISSEEKQDLLDTFVVEARLKKLTTILNRELRVLEIGTKIQEEAKKEIDKKGREMFLREQLKAIREELGEGDDQVALLKELKEKIDAAKMPPEADKVARDELKRLESMNPGAAEYSVSRTYVEWLASLPWSVSTEDNLDIRAARKILDDDHYDLEKVKERILEYLAVLKLRKDLKGPILCFVGPPGVGKTSLGRSIARAIGRKFIRISLGGVRDEAEIRGHRRTYVGALPGRVIQSLKKAGARNPVFMLDEVDKLGADFRGDPSAALLEVLDPEQNSTFSDHYLEVPFDLSHVLFIATANMLDTIPPALRDRLEILRLPGYTEEEKIGIARRHLVPKQLKEHGLPSGHVRFAKEALARIIRDYTRENGLRNLEREIANICRKVARELAEGKPRPTNGKLPPRVIESEDVRKMLGPEKFFREVAERTSEAGVATGLAWTPVGGEVLFVEATRMDGSKSFTVTGQLGDVMRESALAALSCVRNRARKLGIDPDIFQKSDIHLHVPAGAVPKDGPSAGITMAVALVSLLTKKPVRSDVAMTGEITLRGKVLPVGGIKEKVLAALRAGIKAVILPERNETDLEEIDATLRKELRFHFVSSIDDVLKRAFDAPQRRKKRGSGSRPGPARRPARGARRPDEPKRPRSSPPAAASPPPSAPPTRRRPTRPQPRL